MGNRSASPRRETKPAIVLLHGFLASSEYWRRLVPLLKKKGYPVFTIDLLGFGASRNEPATNYDYSEHVAYIHKKVAEQGIDYPFILVGHSMGALISARYTIRYPRHVSNLYLLNPPIYRSRDEVRTSLRDTNRFYRLMLDSPVRNKIWRTLQSLPFAPIAKHADRARELSMVNVIETAELLGDIAKLRRPATVVIGRYERPEYVKNIADAIKTSHATLIIQDGTHHMPLLRPRDTAHLILSGLHKDV